MDHVPDHSVDPKAHGMTNVQAVHVQRHRQLNPNSTRDNKMEATIVYWGYIGEMEKKMETTIRN